MFDASAVLRTPAEGPKRIMNNQQPALRIDPTRNTHEYIQATHFEWTAECYTVPCLC
jgi:hypothetical protein